MGTDRQDLTLSMNARMRSTADLATILATGLRVQFGGDACLSGPCSHCNSRRAGQRPGFGHADQLLVHRVSPCTTAETIDVVTGIRCALGCPRPLAVHAAGLFRRGSRLRTADFRLPGTAIRWPESSTARASSACRLSYPIPAATTTTTPCTCLFFNAAQVFAAQEKVISFSGGSGVRFVTQ